MCLTGVDYFSTLGYQPTIAFEATGKLSPLATLVLVVVTLLGAVPVYRYVAGSSPHGQGSIAMLERLVRGWSGKTLILVLLGFAATDFVITKTLSAADAAEHLIHNPAWGATPQWLHSQMLVTLTLLVGLGAMFMRGFGEVIGLAVLIVGVYLSLNFVLIGLGLKYLFVHPELIQAWLSDVQSGNWSIDAAHLPLHGHGWPTIIALCCLFFPKLALGLSGFETGVAVMPLIKQHGETEEERLASRVRGARRLLLTAAVIMSLFLIGSSLVTVMLVDPMALRPAHDGLPAGPATNRTLAYLAHGESHHAISPIFGETFGTIYDISTVVILWFAGASAMAGLLNLVPQYLPRYGMAPEWARAMRPLVLLFTAINVLVTWLFNADVVAQGAAYATGVVVLMTSAATAVVIEKYRRATGLWWRRLPWGYVAVACLFFYTMAAIIVERPAGLRIAICFITAILVTSIVSRTMRSTELRFAGFQFADDGSEFLWDSLRFAEFPVIVPHRPGGRRLEEKEQSIRAEHHLGPDDPIIFLEAQRGDVSEFLHRPTMQVMQEQGRIILKVTNCASIPHVIAAVGLELSKVGRPPEIHFGWSNESPLAANMQFVFFGEGNVPWMVRELILRAENDPAKQPRVIVG